MTTTHVEHDIPWTQNCFTCKQSLGRLRASKPAKVYRVPNSTPVHGMKQSTVDITLRTPTFKYSRLDSQPKQNTAVRLFQNIDVLREYQTNIIERVKTRGRSASKNEAPKPSPEPELEKPASRHSGHMSATEHRQSKSSMDSVAPRPAQKKKLPISTPSLSKKNPAQFRLSACQLECSLPSLDTQASARYNGHPKDYVHTECETQKDDVTFHW